MRKEKKIHTQYIADFPLWVVARVKELSGSLAKIETAWLKSGEAEGPALFVSALDAEIYCRNRLMHEPGWQRLPLEKIDLPQMIRSMGGELYCQMVFGFGATTNGELSLRDGHLRPMFVPLHFELSKRDRDPITINFDKWVFDFMRDQWRIIGAAGYADYLERVSEGDGQIIDQLADAAWRDATTTMVLQDSEDWGVYIPGASTWKYGPREMRQAGKLH
jgi:hypothetical protein